MTETDVEKVGITILLPIFHLSLLGMTLWVLYGSGSLDTKSKPGCVQQKGGGKQLTSVPENGKPKAVR